MYYNNKWVVVAGAGGALGNCIVSHFLKKKANIIGIDKHECVPINYNDIAWIPCDLSIELDVKSVCDKISSITENIDILVNCAGTFEIDPNLTNVSKTITNLWKGNVLSAVFLTFGVYSLLLNSENPLVVNIASTDAVVSSNGQQCEIGVSHDVLYAMTKGAVVTFTRALAMKWAKQNIRVNAICPTIFRSPISESLYTETGKIEELSGYIPLNRLCSKKDIAEAIESLFKLKMTTAHILPVDGGYLCQ